MSRDLITKMPVSRGHAVSVLGLTAAGALLTGRIGSSSTDASGTERDASAETETDFAARFAGFEPADEPNGDLDRVVWPDFVIDAGPDIQRLYAFQVMNGEFMRSMPCFGLCHVHSGHHSHRDCSIREVHEDGSVTFDPMAPVCGACLDVTSTVIDMLDQGSAPRAIRATIDARHAYEIEGATPTPYPPASMARF